MAKSVEKKEKKAKAPDFKDTLYEVVGKALANALDVDVLRVKVEGMPECLLLTNDNGNDYTISITQKKTNVEYEDDHVKVTFSPDTEPEEEPEDNE